jgi:tetrahydromethanopterin:alpha-L-glutamate ligase
MAELAVKATAALAMDYAGVDIICDKEGHYTIIEVNSIPAWKGLESVCDINIADLLTEDLINRCINKNTLKIKSAVS